VAAPVQRSFSGGEIAPSLYARTDQTKYATGLRTCRNMLVQRHGSARLRPGTDFVVEVKSSSSAVRLLRFVFNDDQTYLMEFGDRYIRWVQRGGQVVTGGVAYEIATPYVVADLAALQIVQSADVITITHPSYAPRELARLGHTNWTLSVIAHGPSINAPTNLAVSGGGTGTERWWAVTAIKEGSFEESLASIISGADHIPTSDNPVRIEWDTVAGAVSYNVFRSVDGQTFGLINSSGGVPVGVTDASWVETSEQAIVGTPNTTVAGSGECRNALGISATTKAYNGKYTIIGLTRVLTAFAAGSGGTGEAIGRAQIYYSRDGEPRVLADDVTLDRLSEIGLSDGDFTTAVDTDLTIDVPDNGYSTLTIDIVPVVTSGNSAGAGWNYTLDTAGASATVSWDGGATQFTDAGNAAELSIAPPTQPNLFATVDNYPAAIAHYQQRSVYAGSNAEPEKAYASRTGSFRSFTVSTPLQDDDAVSFALAGREVNRIRHLLDVGRLIAFTSSEVKIIQGDDSGILRPDSINPQKLAKHGIGTLRPLEVDDSAVYVQARGTIVRDLNPIQGESYQGTDLTVFAAHLFLGKQIVDWDYAETPHSILWLVMNDGTMTGLTYLREHGIVAWHRHDTDGIVENVCTVPEGDEDRVYIVVRRTINGATKRYIERMAPVTFTDKTRFTDVRFMDCALTYDGWNAGPTSLKLTGGVTWSDQERLTATASSALFSAGDVGNGLVFITTDDFGVEVDRIRMRIESYTSPTVVKVRPDRIVPTGYRNVETIQWARMVDSVSGLSHLEGKSVSVFADGYVVASPNNTVADYPELVVTGGSITLDQPYAVIHVGLPYIGDIETLDLDSPGPRTVKDKKSLVARVLLMVEDSRGIFVGPGWGPTAADPLANMQEARTRDDNAGYGPIDLLTDTLEVAIETDWNSNGRLLVRQVDPLPLTVLSVAPIMAG
jgi:hypothetical protein